MKKILMFLVAILMLSCSGKKQSRKTVLETFPNETVYEIQPYKYIVKQDSTYYYIFVDYVFGHVEITKSKKIQ